jgi:8-oxo-dGTP pyrophosphatase MutT (NUDIX family)
VTDPAAGLRIRTAVRALLLDPADRVLLVRFVFPSGETRWALPGGGVEPGETFQEALCRELVEELGLHDIEPGPLVWTRTHIIPMIGGEFDGQRDHVHLVRTAEFEPQPTLTWEQLNAELVFELRWWTVDEIRAAGDIQFVPATLAEHLTSLLTDGPPAEPVDVGL